MSPRLNILEPSTPGTVNPQKDLILEDLTVSVHLPVTLVGGATLFPQSGSAKFDAEKSTILWSIGKLTANHTNVKLEALLVDQGGVTVSLNSTKGCVASLGFKVRGWNISGIRVDSVQVSGVNYTPYKGCRYSTCAGRIDLRI